MTPAPRRPTLNEAAHKQGETRPEAGESAGQPGVKRTLNEAAHKLGSWSVRPEPAAKEEGPGSAALRAAASKAGKLLSR